LIDERPVDCCQKNEWDFKSVYVKNPFGEKQWLDVTFTKETDIENMRHDIFYHEYWQSGWGNVRIYGLYTHAVLDDGLSVINFNVKDYSGNYFKPNFNDNILVKYNPIEEIRVFGGDTYIGEELAVFIDDDPDYNAEFGAYSGGKMLRIPLPYFNHMCSLSSDDVVGNFNNITWVKQLLSLFISESRINNPLNYEVNDVNTLSFSRGFPHVNYIWTPHSTTIINGGGMEAYYNLLQSEYKEAYPEEWRGWKSGGFRILPQISMDYSKILNTRFYSSKPVVGYVKKLIYQNRILYSPESKNRR
jgi:hypothetical protein